MTVDGTAHTRTCLHGVKSDEADRCAGAAHGSKDEEAAVKANDDADTAGVRLKWRARRCNPACVRYAGAAQSSACPTTVRVERSGSRSQTMSLPALLQEEKLERCANEQK